MTDTASVLGLRRSALAALLLAAALLAPPAPALAAQQRVHVVQPGETLSGIAARYSTTVTALAAANRIVDADLIWVGQRLTIPGAAAAAETDSAAPAPAAAGLRAAVADFLQQSFIQRTIDERVYYSFTPVAPGQPRLHWFQSIRNHGHENLATLAYASLGRCAEAQGMLRAFYHAQNADGGFPYMVTTDTGPGTSTHANTTLPVLAWEALQIYRRCGDTAFLSAALQAGARNDDWWWLHSGRRDHGSCQGLFFWNETWETVRDDAELATWAATGGAENQCAVDLNAYLVANDRALAAIARELGDGRAALFDSRAAELSDLMNRLMWNAEDSFYYGLSRRGGQVRVRDIGGLMPLYAGVPSAQQAAVLVARHLQLGGDFHAGFGLPSLGKSQPGYGSARRWQGGMWPGLTMLVVKGLADYGHMESAQRITRTLADKVSAGPGNFWEFYDSESGLPSHAQNYIWAATALPMAEFAGLQP